MQCLLVVSSVDADSVCQRPNRRRKVQDPPFAPQLEPSSPPPPSASPSVPAQPLPAQEVAVAVAVALEAQAAKEQVDRHRAVFDGPRKECGEGARVERR